METQHNNYASPDSAPSINKRLIAVAALIRYAEERGLPAPDSVTASPDEVALSFELLADLADWALWFDVQIVETKSLQGRSVVHEGQGPALGAGLRLMHVEHPETDSAPIPFVLTDKWAG
ncbi:MAG: hypothetical protein VX494_04110 [Actinomycetota bacterium]|nr:hypothetical protein [Actinomycetota bacterium]